MKVVLVIFIIGSLVGGCSYVNKGLGLPDDNILEESIEEKIDDLTGLDIDLTPNTTEHIF